MRRRASTDGGRPVRAAVAAAGAAALLALAAAPAQAAKRCAEPGAAWERATPAEAGMDAAKLQQAVDYGSQNLAFAVRSTATAAWSRPTAAPPPTTASASRAGRWPSP
jgi:hypothetical protein